MRVLLALLLLLAPPARAVIIDDEVDGSVNTTPPGNDPGFAHVGNAQGLSAVYIGKRWVLTAAHVAIGPVALGGVTYDSVPDSKVQIQVGSATTPPDLALFRIDPEPPLPDLAIREDPPAVDLMVTMIGNGRNRGPVTSWMGIGGYEWDVGRAIRWGTNVIDAVLPNLVVASTETDSFSTEFTESGGDECQAANGDSGGAVFIENAGTWELAGIMYAVANWKIPNPSPPPEFLFQPPATALYGNLTYAADLSAYRDQILAIRDAPEIPAVPAWGVQLLGGLLGGAGAAALRRRAVR